MKLNEFELATKQKLRFSTTKGLIGVEDLWDLDLEQLDAIYGKLKKEEKENETDSLLDRDEKKNEKLELSLKIVEKVFVYKKEEKNKRLAEAEKAKRRQELLEALDKKRNESLNEKSEEEILAELDQLDKED